MPDPRTVIVLTVAAALCTVQSQSDSNFIFSRGPVPDPFTLHQHYPDRAETVECRPIRLRIERGSHRFITDLVTNEHSSVQFADADARVMSSRLHGHLNELAEAFHEENGVWFTVTKAWTELGDEDVTDPNSLHFEGRSVRVSVATSLISHLLQLAVEVGFDWVLYADEDYVRMSVIPNLCDVSLDIVFMLDRSGSVGEENFDTAIAFLQNVVEFFTIAIDSTRVGLVTYSTDAAVEFDMNDFGTVEDVQTALEEAVYTQGWTATALALRLTRLMLDPNNEYGARPFSDGIPKVAILLTDGRSNQIPITNSSNNLRNFGVQVYAVGIGDVFVPELRFIASDPDEQHVFLLNSFNDAANFVDLLSFTTCDTPAVVEPGEDTISDIEEDEFRFFQSRCAAFSDTVMIEQIDLVGRCFLYVSSSVPNPGPLDPTDSVIRNEDPHANFRSVHLTLPHAQDRFVYVSVLGRHSRNEFTIVIWDMIFEQDEYSFVVPNSGDNTGRVIITLVDQIRDETSAQFNFEIDRGNEEGFFALDSVTGVLTLTTPTLPDTTYRLDIVAQNQEHDCHRSKVVVNVVTMGEILLFDPLPQPVSVSEAAVPGDQVTVIAATSSLTTSLTYAIIDGDPLNQFTIGPTAGDITVAGPLDFEDTREYSLTVQATGLTTTIMAIQVVSVDDIDEPPFFVTPCALAGACSFSVPENEVPGVSVGTVLAEDPDSPPMLTYSIQQPTTSPFEISQSGEITTTDALDFEDVPLYSVTVVVQDDRGDPPLTTQTLVTVSVINVEENLIPVFVTNCSIEVVESIEIGEAFLRCVASDADEQGNPVFDLTYEIITGGNTGGAFRLDPDMGAGVIVPAVALDRETVPSYTLTLVATDPGGLSGSTTFDVVLLDVNDTPPSCTAPSSTIMLLSATLPQPPGRVVTTFTATDPDLNPLPPQFSIESVDTPPQSLISNIIVRVTDGEDPTLSSTCSLSVEFETECLIQEYSIGQSTGVLSARLLCSARVVPPVLAIRFGRSREIECEAVANVGLNYRFRLNGTSITPLEVTDSLVLFLVDFDDSGEYTCDAMNNNLGTIGSASSIVSIITIPEITTPPSDVEVQVGENATFSCFATGIPDPDITWLSENDEEVISDGRIVVSGSDLTFSEVQSGDAGAYTCRASNTAGTTTATAQLTVFEPPQLVVAEIPEYMMPAHYDNCHEFNTTDFNSVMTSITGYSTRTTDQISDDLCPPSPCNPSPCENEGVCAGDVMSPGGFVCVCNIRYTGSTCSEVIDPCTRTPCYNDGLCASTSRGEFVCACPGGYHGDRCQYTDVCLTSDPCAPEEMCVETVVRSEGYVCVSGELGEGGEGVTVTVEGGTDVQADLDGEVNEYIEDAADLGRRRRDSVEDNGFVTVCEGRFIPSQTFPDTFVLVWACPEGVPAPGGADEEAICRLLIEQRLVSSCTSSEGGTIELTPITPLPPTSINITFLLLNPSTGRPLSASQVLTILDQTNALARLDSTIYRTTRFSTVAPVEERSSESDNGGTIAGAVLGSLAAAIILTVVVATVLIIVRRKRHPKITALDNEIGFPGQEQNGNGTINSATFSNHYSQLPLNDANSLNETFLAPSPGNQETLFDDPVHEGHSYRPPVTTATKKSSSLERGMRSSLERGMKLMRSRVSSIRRSETEAGETLLNPAASSSSSLDNEDSGEYNEVAAHSTTPPLSVATPTSNGSPGEETDEIYANIAHHREGALGNAGQRWESYWQNRTLIRTNAPEPDPHKK